MVAREVAVLFALIGVGVVCRRAKLVDEFAITGLVNVLILVVNPALVLDVFQRPFDRAMLSAFLIAFLIASAVHVALIVLSRVTARGGAAERPVLRLATVFSNAGFMGLPLQQAVLGEQGVFFGVVYVATFNVFIWSWGLVTMRGRAEGEGAAAGTLRAMLVNPGTIGVAIGLPLFLFSVSLPTVIRTPVHLLGQLNTPLAMLVIGYYLAGAKLGAVVLRPTAHTAAFLRLIACPLLLVAALYPYRGSLDRTMMLAMVTASSAPVAAMVTMFAAKYRRDTDLSVGLVSGTTLMSIVTMPAVIALAMHYL